MKLKEYNYSLDEQLSEFDNWVTPSLGELKDFVEISLIVKQLKVGFDYLSTFTESFKDSSTCTGRKIAESIVLHINSQSSSFQDLISSVINAILLSTGKTDNNLKCQYPLYLTRRYGLTGLPKGTKIKAIPRTISLDNYIGLLTEYQENSMLFNLLLESYLQILLSDNTYCSMLQTLGSSYLIAKSNNNEDSLLIPLAVFQSRGSLTAKGGHVPENIVRSYLSDWGLTGDIDYNLEDIDVYTLLGLSRPNDDKIRKFDFILPFKSKQNGKKLFIQSQYYAGDSGSVSHKVVDQTDASRQLTSNLYNDALFVELLDGAGYYSSLNGDLKKMLRKDTTLDFFQLRTAPLKLRRRLQGIDFLTTLEIEHCILKGNSDHDSIKAYLISEGYTADEVERGLAKSINEGKLDSTDTSLAILPERFELSVKYALLDCISLFGNRVNPEEDGKGYYYVPGNGNFWGIKQTELIKRFKLEFPLVNSDSEFIVRQLQWLIDNQFVILL